MIIFKIRKNINPLFLCYFPIFFTLFFFLQKNMKQENMAESQQSSQISDPQKTETYGSIDEPPPPLNVNQSSPHIHTYSQYFKQFQQQVLNYHSYFCQKFKQDNIIYDQANSYHLDRGTVIIQEFAYNSSQIVIYKIQSPFFTLKVSLLNVRGSNPFLRHAFQKQGSYGSIYFFSFLGELIAIKVFIFSRRANALGSIKSAIRQFSIMNICSLLECGPSLERNFGFDLIAYDDSVMFCMEKCTDLQTLSRESVNSLKMSLQVMHHFGIIHFVIKPENIMFSPKFQKPVFIDFGFSEAIAEGLGYKKFVQFRGSPAYCCDEMTAILGLRNTQKYIDVYYNDLHALKISLQQMKVEKTFHYHLEYTVELQDQQQDLKPNIQSELIQNRLLLVLAQYRLMMKDLESIVLILKLKQYFLIKQHGNDIMDFSKRFLSQLQFKMMYEKLQKQFDALVGRAAVQQQFRFYYGAYFYQSVAPSHEKGFGSGYDFSERTAGPKEEQMDFFSLKKYRQLLDIQHIYANHADKAKSALIECLRFDKYNNTLEDKIELSNRLNHAFGISTQRGLNSVKLAFQFLLEDCMSDPVTQWKRDHIFRVLKQLLMLDVNLQPFLDKLPECLIKLYPSELGLVNCWMKLRKIAQVHSFQYVFDYSCMKEKVSHSLFSIGDDLLQEGLARIKKSTCEEVLSIGRVLDLYFCEKDPALSHNYFIMIYFEVGCGKYDRFKEELLELIFLEMLVENYARECYQEAHQFYEAMRYFNFYHVIRQDIPVFTYAFYHLYLIFVATRNYREIIKMCNKAKEIINCEEVTATYKFQLSIFLFSDNKDQKIVKKCALEMFESPVSLIMPRFRVEFVRLVQKIQLNEAFCKENPQIIDKMIKKMPHLDGLIDSQKQYLNFDSIEKAMFMYSLIKFFLHYNEGACCEYLDKLIRQYKQKIAKLQDLQNPKGKYYQLHYNIYLSIQYYRLKLPLKRLQVLQILYNISRQINCQKLIYYFLKRMISLATMFQVQDKLLHYTWIFYNLSHSIPSLARYYQDSGRYIISITSTSFRKQALFYNFLVLTSKFVQRFPTKEIIAEWNINLIKLMSIDKFLLLLSYKRLIQHQPQQSNHYYIYYLTFSLQIQRDRDLLYRILIKIAKSIDFLSAHAKQLIMPTYARHFISYFQSKRRKFGYLAYRWGFKYLERNEIQHIFKRLARLKKQMTRFSNKHANNYLKVKFVKAISN